jgi:hypothetical protein
MQATRHPSNVPGVEGLRVVLRNRRMLVYYILDMLEPTIPLK